MIFGKWQGILYHESLKDLIMEETLFVEILPGEKPNAIKAFISEEGKSFQASGHYYPDQSSLFIEYKDKSATIKADFLVETMKIVGTYSFKNQGRREISMVLELFFCQEAGK